MKYELTQPQLQAILNVLVKLPYEQIFPLMDELRALKPVEPAKPTVKRAESGSSKETNAKA